MRLPSLACAAQKRCCCCVCLIICEIRPKSCAAPAQTAGRSATHVNPICWSVSLDAWRLLALQAEPCCACARAAWTQRSLAPCQLGCLGAGLHKLCALQADLLATVEDVFIPDCKGMALSGPRLASAALQLLPLALTRRVSALDANGRLPFLGGRLVRTACRVAALLRSTLCL